MKKIVLICSFFVFTFSLCAKEITIDGYMAGSVVSILSNENFQARLSEAQNALCGPRIDSISFDDNTTTLNGERLISARVEVVCMDGTPLSYVYASYSGSSKSIILLNLNWY